MPAITTRPNWALALAAAFAGIIHGAPITTGYTGGPSLFTVGGTPYSVGHNFVPSQLYTVNIPNDAIVYLDPLASMAPTNLIHPEGDVLAAMKAEFPESAGWIYTNAPNRLSDGSFIVHLYKAYEGGGEVGAEFMVEYHENGGTDPTQDLHWIQVFHADHEPDHGTYVWEVDHVFANSPYYDHGGVANSTFFYDNPFTSDSNLPHDWDFYLFLVRGPAVIEQQNGSRYPTPGELTFYGGIHWGWENEVGIPEPTTSLLAAPVLLLFIVARRRGRERKSWHPTTRSR
jgi:hypothetical protein